MRRKLLSLSTVLLVLAIAPSASATKPIREFVPGQGDFVIAGQCAFSVLGQIAGPEIITTFTDASGNPVKQIIAFPGNKITLTNMQSGASITIMGTGSSQLRVRPDGSLSARTMGHGPFFPHPVTGAAGIWYLSGQGRATFDADGNMTSAVLQGGKLVNLCPSLAA